MGTKILYLRDLSLLLSLVYYFQSSTIILDRSLPHYASALISVVSVTSLCHIVFLRLKLRKIFDSHYWGAFNLASAYITTADDNTNWNSWHGRVLLIAGLSFLAVYFVTVRIRSYVYPSKEEQEVNPEMPVTPLLVEISCILIGNGVALIGRGLIPEESVDWAIAGAAVMLFLALLFFTCFVHCSFEIESQMRPHTE